MNYYIGIDGGGTKTAFICYNQNHRLINECILESCHVLQVDQFESIRILKQGVLTVLENAHDIENVYICAGLAGYGKDISLRLQIEKICKQAFDGYHYMIDNDASIALHGALNGEDGILVIAGTGSMALAKIEQSYQRVGGWGYILGDEGSAYWIGKELLNCFTQQADGRMAKTQLYTVLKNYCKLKDDYDLISYVNQTLFAKRDEIAKFALIAYQLAQDNEPNALYIYKIAANELSKLINTLATMYNKKVKVSTIGGVWKGMDLLGQYLSLNENVELIQPLFSPCYGAYLMAKKHFSH